MSNKAIGAGVESIVKPAVVWFNQLAGADGGEIPGAITQNFAVCSATSETHLELILKQGNVSAVFFDFDYPDRHRLSRFADTKHRHSSVPMIMLSLQHSESLVKWAFRAGAMDFLVKPVSQSEAEAVVDRLLVICSMKKSQRLRTSRRHDAPIPAEVPHAVRTPKNRLEPAVHYVQQHYNEHIYSDAMARLCDMSASSFSHAFSKAYGLTFQEFLLRYRVNRACSQLRSPEKLQISDVAYSVGFTDPSYFARVFKRYIGVTPSEFAALKVQRPCDTDVASVEDPLSSSQVVRALSSSFES